MQITFAEGTETHYAVCKGIADPEFVVLLHVKGESPDPRKAMVIAADDQGLTFVPADTPYNLRGAMSIAYTYDQIESLEIL